MNPHKRHTLNYYYALWQRIKQRCYNANNSDYKNYGARGITMLDEWFNDFDCFVDYIIEELGPRPDNMSLDRINNNGNYEPGNLRWATRRTQALNRRPNPSRTNTGIKGISLVCTGYYRIQIYKNGVCLARSASTFEKAKEIKLQLEELKI